jgi:hypothetical protein
VIVAFGVPRADIEKAEANGAPATPPANVAGAGEGAVRGALSVGAAAQPTEAALARMSAKVEAARRTKKRFASVKSFGNPEQAGVDVGHGVFHCAARSGSAQLVARKTH